jgi:hypothetical protein
MKKILTTTLLILFFLSAIAIGWLKFSGNGKRILAVVGPKRSAKYNLPAKSFDKLQSKAIEVRSFAEKNNFNNNICFLVDMSLPSGENRFFVYDLNKDTIQKAGLVTHGNCNERWLEGRKYGNSPGCGCTSLGKYKIGNNYHGKFGLAFKLYGLDKTNSNAYSRAVVLHSHECVPESEVQDEICQSLGCPTVAPGFLKQLNTIITSSKKPVLLWIFQ